jgi:hypothetical protein
MHGTRIKITNNVFTQSHSSSTRQLVNC